MMNLFMLLSLAAASTDFNSLHYADLNSRIVQDTAIANFIAQTPFRGDEKVLDVGCGDCGATVKHILTKTPNGCCYGVDPSEDMLAYAKKTYNPHKNLFLITSSAENMAKTLTPNYFDIATSFFALHWCDDINKALINIHTALKPRGKAYFTLCAKNDPQDPFMVALRAVEKTDTWASRLPKATRQLTQYTAEDMRNRLEQADLTVDYCSADPMSHQFETKRTFYQWFSGWSPYTSFLGEEAHWAFFNDVLAQYQKVAPADKNYETFYLTSMLYVRVTKDAPAQ